MKSIQKILTAVALLCLCLPAFAKDKDAPKDDPTLRVLEGHKDDIRSLAFNPDGRFLASGGKDNLILIWDVEKGAEILSIEFGANVNALCFDPEGKYLAGGEGFSILRQNEVKLYNRSTGIKLNTLTSYIGRGVDYMKFSQDGKFLFISTKNKLEKIYGLQLFDLQANQDRFLQFPVNATVCEDFSPNGRYVVAGIRRPTPQGSSGQASYVLLWDIAKQRTVHDILIHDSPTAQFGFTHDVISIAFNSDGTRFAYGNEDKHFAVRETESGKEVFKVTDCKSSVRNICFSPNSAYLVTGFKKQVSVWDLATVKEVLQVEAKLEIEALAFSPIGDYIAYTDKNKIMLKDVSTLEKMADFVKIKRFEVQKKVGIEEGLAPLFAPKDEFETDADYKTRLVKGEAEKKAIEEKYAQKIAQVEKEINAKQQADYDQWQAEAQAKIRASLTEVATKIDGLGIYKPDQELYPITINGVTQDVKIPRMEARSLKEKWQSAQVRGMQQLKADLTTYEVFNLVIIHPETGNQFPFGEQRDLAAGGATRTVTTTSTGSVVPPNLTMKATLQEPSGNGFLDAEEKGKIIVEIANSGAGTAHVRFVDLKIEMPDPDLIFSGTRGLGDIPPSATKKVEFDLEAKSAIQRKMHTFTITAEEANNFNPNPVKLSFETYPLLLPEIAVVHGLTTADGSNIAKPGITTTIQVRMQNKGQGIARNVQVKVNLPPTLKPFEVQSVYTFAELKPNDVQDFEFQVTPTPAAKEEEEITLSLTEAHTQGKFPLKIAINKPSLAIAEFNVQGKEAERVAITDIGAGGLEIIKDLPNAVEPNPDAFAVVIGNRNYRAYHPDVPNVDYAERDAAAMKEYLIKTLGYKDGNVLIRANATHAVFRGLFGTETEPRGELYNLVKPGKSDVFIYYCGHGAPDVQEKRGYFVPVDCSPSQLRINGYSLDLFYSNLSQIPARSFTITIDACFSGGSSQGMLIASASPIGIQVLNPALKLPNAAIFTSSSGDEISSWYPEKQHSLFTYFYLQGLRGAADSDRNGEVTAQELQIYLTDPAEGVPYYARSLYNGRQQTPVFQGQSERLVRGKVK